MSMIWYLMGPTASGKTEVAVQLAQRFPFEIISVDAALVYTGLDIGTAKPAASLLAQSPHHLIDVRAPDQTYSAAEFYRDATQLIQDIQARGKVPLLVGGTMFYFHVLESGLPNAPNANPDLRRELEKRAANCGHDALYNDLVMLDPERARQINPADRQRVQRALEIFMLSGKSATEAPRAGTQGFTIHNQSLCKLALVPPDRSWLHKRIAARFELMLNNGLVEEVRNLLDAKNLSPELPALRMVGYRQVVDYLLGHLEYNEMERRGIAATRQLAKRQLTWLRNQRGVTWVDCTSSILLATLTEYIGAKLSARG